MRDVKLAGCVHWSSHFTSGIGGRRRMDDVKERGGGCGNKEHLRITGNCFCGSGV